MTTFNNRGNESEGKGSFLFCSDWKTVHLQERLNYVIKSSHMTFGLLVEKIYSLSIFPVLYYKYHIALPLQVVKLEQKHKSE